MGGDLSVVQALRAELMCFRFVVMSSFHNGFALMEGFLAGMALFAAFVIMSRRSLAPWSRVSDVMCVWRSCHCSLCKWLLEMRVVWNSGHSALVQLYFVFSCDFVFDLTHIVLVGTN